MLTLVYGVFALVGDSVNAFNANKALYIEQLDYRISSATDWVAAQGVPIESVSIASAIEKADIMSLVTRVVGGVGVIFGDFFVIFLTVIFILAETTSFPTKFAKAFLNAQDKMVHINDVLSKIRHYLAIKAATSILTGVLVAISLLFIGVDYPFFMGDVSLFIKFYSDYRLSYRRYSRGNLGVNSNRPRWCFMDRYELFCH
jgi:predicted PurR-regulated permease PerM